MKFEIYSTRIGYLEDTLLAEYPQLRQFNMTREKDKFVQHCITISSLEELEKLGKLLGERLIIDFESYCIEIYDDYRE